MDKLANGIWQIKKMLNTEECNLIVKIACSGGFTIAHKQAMGRYNQETFIESSEVYLMLFYHLQRCICECHEIASIISIQQIIECYRYYKGDYITPHYDRAREIEPNIWSTHTLLVYLSDSVIGGETAFPKKHIRVIPELGKALLFEHGVLHQAIEVLEGVKYVSRANIALAKYKLDSL
uniref:Prolyl 4-hydroxylase alpha subunit domain-containing protein n=1 Tax=Planktothrix pseudagardhii TaxID=132604 RepID=A0A9W4G4D6_9CYAN|nr:hypothetical protein NO713_01152 [Planktothrix pseudagardhii]